MPRKATEAWKLGLFVLAAILFAPAWAANRLPAETRPLCGPCEEVHLEDVHSCVEHSCPCMGPEASLPSRHLQSSSVPADFDNAAPFLRTPVRRGDPPPLPAPERLSWLVPPSPHAAGVGLLLHA